MFPNFLSALRDFQNSKLKTALTALGITIGVFAVVLLSSFGLGLQSYLKQQLEDLGVNTLYIYPGNILQNQGPNSGTGSILFDEKDLRELSRLNQALRVVPVAISRGTATNGSDNKLTDIYATNHELFALRNLKVQAGRLFDSADVAKGARVAVVGPQIAEKLFKSPARAIGQSMKISSQRVQIIGVLEEKGGTSLGGPDFDAFTYIPYTGASAWVTENQFQAIYLQARSDQDVSTLKQQAEQLLGRRYKKDAYSVIEQKEIIQTAGAIFNVVNVVLLAIGSISLLVGGIGIMNIMYATVTARTKEVGIRRALGATRADVRNLFLAEATVLCLIGALMGILLAAGIILYAQRYFPLQITLGSISTAVGVAVVIGLFFGVFPARRAAGLPPIEAIRYE